MVRSLMLGDVAELFTGSEPVGLPKFLAAPEAGATYFAGTAIRSVGSFRQRPSGIWTPSTAHIDAAPIGQIGVCLTFEEVFGRRATMDFLIAILAKLPRDVVLNECAGILARLRQPDTGPRSELQTAAIDMIDPGLARDRIRNLTSSGRHLLSPQGILAMAKVAIVHCPVQPAEQLSVIPTALLSLVIHDLLGDTFDLEASPKLESQSLPAALFITANGYFNHTDDAILALALHAARWYEADDGNGPSLDEICTANGVPLHQQTAFAILLWAQTLKGRVKFDDAFFAHIAGGPRAAHQALRLLTQGVDDAALKISETELSHKTLEFNFNAFGRYPILRLADSELLVVDPQLLLRRVLGWAPTHDLPKTLVDGTKKGTIEAALARRSETYTIDVINAGVQASRTGRVFTESDLTEHFTSQGRLAGRTADAGIDYGDAWIILEITAHRVPLAVVNALSDESIAEAVERVLDEVDQIHQTIQSLQQHPLGGHDKHPRRFYPVVVMTEGYPINPILLTIIREAAATRGFAQGTHIAPIEVTDLATIEYIVGIAEAGGQTMREILDAKATSNFHAAGLGDYIAHAQSMTFTRPANTKTSANDFLTRITAELNHSAGTPDV